MRIWIFDVSENLKELIVKKALEAGFDVVRVTRPDAIPEAASRLKNFLDKQWHGDMAWMERNAGRRQDPQMLWPDAKSVIVVGLNYGPKDDPLALLKEKGRAVISVYAQGKDYHDIVKSKLKQVASWFHQKTGGEVKVFVDTAPLMEKPLGGAAGLGWQGKHTNLVSRQFGSWLFLGSIFTTIVLDPDASEEDHCGSCRRCLDICPTDAFPAPYELDARRCISYLTIEHKGHIPMEFRIPIGNRIYGCDDCLAVCPWNKYATVAREVRLHARECANGPMLTELLSLDDRGFRERFSGSPIKRTGRDRFIRNVLIAAGNSGDRELCEAVKPLLKDNSPLVRAMAVWAMQRLVTRQEFADLRQGYLSDEQDPYVLDEWQGGQAS